MAALLEILYLIVPDAYLKDDVPAAGATGTAGCDAEEVGNGLGTPDGELRAPLQASTDQERRHQHLFRSEIFMYCRLMLFEENKQPPGMDHWRLSY
jgi:hypothetical protein